MEEYRNVKWYESIYEVSNEGNIRSVKSGNILKGFTNPRGYTQINLFNGIERTYYVHKLVAEAFLEKVEGKTEIDHINNDKSNNNVSNLRYCTHQENCRNKRMMSNNTSGVKGVNWDKDVGMWRARIKCDTVRVHLGYFQDLQEAKKIRMERAIKEFGEFINDCETV
jgi:hypothetical protein